MSTNKAHRKFVSSLLGTSSTKNIQPCINGKTLSLDFVRKRRPKQEHRVIPSRKYASASGDIYVPHAISDNPLAQHLHQLAFEALNAPNEHVEDIDSTQSPRPRARTARHTRLDEHRVHEQRNNPHRTVKREPKSHRSETARTILGNKTKYITEQQQLLHQRGTHRVNKRPVSRVNHEQQPVSAGNVSNAVVHETPATPCTRSRVMFAGSTPGCELTRDTPQRLHSDKLRQDDDTCHSSELQIDSSPMILTNGWSTCHSATPHPSTRAQSTNQQSVTRDSSVGSVNDSADSVNDSDNTPPSTFKWHVIESMARDHQSSPLSPPVPPAAADEDDDVSTPKQRTIQRLFQQNCYLKRRVRDLTQHLLRANKTQFL